MVSLSNRSRWSPNPFLWLENRESSKLGNSLDNLSLSKIQKCSEILFELDLTDLTLCFFCKLGLDTQLAIGMGHGGQSPASNLEEDEEYDYDYDYNMVSE